tara:strand:- start:3665 stop:3895 length:231 start_codon:yes stop_codon:yes gene_type:complete
MNLDEPFELEHILLKERKCRSCEVTKDLIADFYLIRKDRGAYPSAYSYECKVCTVKRILKNRKKNQPFPEWTYPDW